MKDRLERFVILPFTAGCISESSIPVVPTQHTRRSKQGSNSAPTEEKKDGEEGCLVDEESLSGQNSKTNLPKFQKLFKNFKNLSQIFGDKDELEREMGMEIGFPTDVKHVAHIGWDSCDNSIFSKGWNDLAAQDLIDLHSSQLDLAIKAHAETSKITSFLETKYHFNNAIAQ